MLGIAGLPTRSGGDAKPKKGPEDQEPFLDGQLIDDQQKIQDEGLQAQPLAQEQKAGVQEQQSTKPPAFQFANSALDFMLNEDLEEVEEEFSSSEEDE